MSAAEPPGLERQLIIRGTLSLGLRSRRHARPEEVERYLRPRPRVHIIIGRYIVLGKSEDVPGSRYLPFRDVSRGEWGRRFAALTHSMLEPRGS